MKMCSYNNYRQAPLMMAMNANAQFSHHRVDNWFGNAGYYSDYHSDSTTMSHQPRSTITYVRESMKQNSQSSKFSWSGGNSIINNNNNNNTNNNNYNNYINYNTHHQNTNMSWMSSYSSMGVSQCLANEYSNDGSDFSGSPGSVKPNQGVFDWMKKNSTKNAMSLIMTDGRPMPGRTRTKDKYRIVYTDQQKLELEKEYCYNRFITAPRKQALAEGLGLSERQIKIWFQNRRAKERKISKKSEGDYDDDCEF